MERYQRKVATGQSIDLAIMNYCYTGQAMQSIGIALIPFGAQLAVDAVRIYKKSREYEDMAFLTRQ
jgi:hypothetical protein